MNTKLPTRSRAKSLLILIFKTICIVSLLIASILLIEPVTQFITAQPLDSNSTDPVITSITLSPGKAVMGTQPNISYSFTQYIYFLNVGVEIQSNYKCPDSAVSLSNNIHQGYRRYLNQLQTYKFYLRPVIDTTLCEKTSGKNSYKLSKRLTVEESNYYAAYKHHYWDVSVLRSSASGSRNGHFQKTLNGDKVETVLLTDVSKNLEGYRFLEEKSYFDTHNISEYTLESIKFDESSRQLRLDISQMLSSCVSDKYQKIQYIGLLDSWQLKNKKAVWLEIVPDPSTQMGPIACPFITTPLHKVSHTVTVQIPFEGHFVLLSPNFSTSKIRRLYQKQF